MSSWPGWEVSLALARALASLLGLLGEGGGDLITLIQYSKDQYSTVQYSTVQYSKDQYSTVQYSTVENSTVQYSKIQ